MMAAIRALFAALWAVFRRGAESEALSQARAQTDAALAELSALRKELARAHDTIAALRRALSAASVAAADLAADRGMDGVLDYARGVLGPAPAADLPGAPGGDRAPAGPLPERAPAAPAEPGGAGGRLQPGR